MKWWSRAWIAGLVFSSRTAQLGSRKPVDVGQLWKTKLWLIEPDREGEPQLPGKRLHHLTHKTWTSFDGLYCPAECAAFLTSRLWLMATRTEMRPYSIGDDAGRACVAHR
ncbi:hypothetical protein BDY17DRAFT_162199 [Neohortaea acidophila]|uniref:Secreted protein n=1 Tax=Neohortaea acidophila TaxID=245834 RepID=A0A6A6PSV5_9PEZI|nr:uncharacterized protein BDY17DRAFT_162199 [Neohortaea acidophila]KAF2482573.1 hypothetical protein BDY17DRAFT_162199 [Neohortaea acidophila]